MVAKTTPLAAVPVGPMTTEKNPGQHQGISIVMDHTMKLVSKTEVISQISGKR